MTSLLDITESNRVGALEGFKAHSQLEENRNNANESLRSQHRARRASAVGGGIGTGIAAAAAFGGPVGIGVGAAAMLIGGLL